MKATEEQEQVVYADEHRLLVEARAGSGKSATLRMYADARPMDRFLYLAFSKAVQLEAVQKMPNNTRCMTTHGLCWPTAVKLFGGNEQARAKTGNTFPSTVARRLGCTPLTAAAAIETIHQFCASVETDISAVHVPSPLAERLKHVDKVLDAARTVWQLMLAPKEHDIRLPHDGYLKISQLEAQQIKRYTRILVDEFQDMNPSSLALLLGQTCGLTGVGDPYQQIFQFRGSVDGMSVAKADKRLYLTRSFRFGEGIASLANTLLLNLRREKRPTIGCGEVQKTAFTVDRSKPYAFLARTNGAVIEQAVSLFTDPRPLIFVGGVERYRLDAMIDAHHLWRKEHGNIKDAYLRSFNGLDELDKLADETSDAELMFLVKVVKDYANEVPAIVNAIRQKARAAVGRDASSLNAVTLSTVHKAKGLEWDQVVLASDFAALLDKAGKPLSPEGVCDEDLNLHYVAITRARAAIEIGDQLAQWLRHPQVGGARQLGLPLAA